MITIAGLTGSIAMGKSTAAKQFEKLGLPIFDSDACVHELFKDAEVIEKISTLFPDAVQSGEIDRHELGKIAYANQDNIEKLEKLLHPLVLQKLFDMATKQAKSGQKLLIADVPLLFEVGWKVYCDYVFVVHTDEDIQKQRALSRPEMTEERFNKIKDIQMRSIEKCKWADFVIDTSTMDIAMERIKLSLGSIDNITKGYETLASYLKEKNL